MSAAFFLPPNHRVFSMSTLSRHRPFLRCFSRRFRYFVRVEQFPDATEPSPAPFFPAIASSSSISRGAATLFATVATSHRPADLNMPAKRPGRSATLTRGVSSDLLAGDCLELQDIARRPRTPCCFHVIYTFAHSERTH